ncbi:hypothetical protein SB724_19535, partial [Bacillus sp. SIMBA_031]
MKKNRRIYFQLLWITLFLANNYSIQSQVKNNDKNLKMNSFTDKGNHAPKENFTGTVWVNLNIGKDDDYNTIIGTVTFEPKARTNWHTHTT